VSNPLSRPELAGREQRDLDLLGTRTKEAERYSPVLQSGQLDRPPSLTDLILAELHKRSIFVDSRPGLAV
jgi:hypothetical protein